MTQPTPEQIQQWALPDQCNVANIRNSQGQSEYRNLSWEYDETTAKFSVKQMHEAFAAGAASRDAEFAPFLKDGETPFERFTGERKDGDALLKVYGKALTEIETLRIQLAALRAPITPEAAYDMGSKGAEPTEQERLLFEEWMRGHCWALCAHWDGKQYASDEETNGMVSMQAMVTRRLFGAWRDRAALYAAPTPQEPVNQMLLDAVALAYGHLWHINNEPMAPIPLRSDGEAAYAARKILRDLLTTEQRGNGINQARAAIAAAEQQGAGK